MFLLDTVVLSELRRRPRNDPVARWLSRQNSDEVFLSAITIMEIERGIEQQRRANPPFAAKLETWLGDNIFLFGDRILPITIAIARLWGRMQFQLGRDDDDLAIAATAVEHGLQVVTRNTKDFRATGVTIINPFET